MKKAKSNLLPSALTAVAAALLPVTAFAHVGHGTSGATAGILHPLTGIDHLLGMIAVGMWGAQLGGKRVWMLPATFVGCMVCGGLLAAVHVPAWLIEEVVLTSVLVMGALVAFSVRTPTVLGVLVIGGFGAFNGYAHGAELPAGTSALTYGVGFVISTAMLQFLCVSLCLVLQKLDVGPRTVRACGACIAACGALLLVATF